MSAQNIIKNRIQNIDNKKHEIYQEAAPLPQIKMSLRQTQNSRFVSPITNIQNNKFNHQTTISPGKLSACVTQTSQQTAYQYRSDLFHQKQVQISNNELGTRVNVYGAVNQKDYQKIQSIQKKGKQSSSMNLRKKAATYSEQQGIPEYQNQNADNELLNDYYNFVQKEESPQKSHHEVQNYKLNGSQVVKNGMSNVFNLDFQRSRNLPTEASNQSPRNLDNKRSAARLPSIQRSNQLFDVEKRSDQAEELEQKKGSRVAKGHEKSKINQLEQFIKIIDVQQQRQFMRPNLFESEDNVLRSNFNFQENVYHPQQMPQMNQTNRFNARQNESRSLFEVIRNNESQITNSVNNKQILSQRQFMHRGALRFNQNDQFGNFRIDGAQFGQTIGTQFRNLSSLRNQSVAQQKQTALHFASFSSGTSPNTVLNHRTQVIPDLQVTGFSSLKQNMRGSNKLSNDAFTQYAQLQQENKKLEEQISEMRYREFICQSPKRQVDQTAFVIDCQSLKIFQEISKEKLILLRGSKGELVSQQNQSKQLFTDTKLTEFQIIEFILEKIWKNRLQEQVTQLPQLTPKTSKILNTISAQAKLQIPSEIPKIDTIVLEIDFEEFKNLQLIKPLYQSFGRRVVNGIYEQGRKVTYKFQTIDQYIDKVKTHHERQVKQANAGNQALIDKINSEIQHFDLQNEQKEPRVIHKILTSPFSSKVSQSHKMTPKENDSITSMGFMKDSSEFEGLPSMKPKLVEPTFNIEPDQDHSEILQEVLDSSQRLNVQIINRNSRLYNALVFHDQEQRKAPGLFEDSTHHSEVPCNLSTMIKLPDPSLIKFLLFCKKIGVLTKLDDVLSSFFRNVLIVLKPSLLGDVKKENIQELLINQVNLSEQDCFEIENKLQEGSSYMNIQQNSREKSLSPQRPMSGVERFESKMLQKKSPVKNQLCDVDPEPIEFDWGGAIEQPTTIQIYHEPYTHLEISSTNRFFRIYNKFIQLVFKHKALEFQKKDLDLIFKLAQVLNIHLPKKPPGHQMYNAGKTSFWVEHFKSSQSGGMVKENLYKSLNKHLNQQNGFSTQFQDYVMFQKPFTQTVLNKKEKKKVQNLNQTTMNRQESTVSKLRADSSMTTNFYQGNSTKDGGASTFSPYYKYAVGIGNNHPLIKNILKLRFWYHNSKNQIQAQDMFPLNQDAFQLADIIWTQWRRMKVIDQNLEKHHEFQQKHQEILNSLSSGQLPPELNDPEAKQELVSQINKRLPIIRQKLQRIYNRLEFNQHLNNKKALLFNMKNFYQHCQLPELKQVDVFDVLPLTFHIKEGLQDQNFEEFKVRYEQEQGLHPLKKSSVKNLWIIKPGENSNRGQRIKVENNFDKICQTIESYCTNNSTVIVQKYITNPLLYKNRKFDIRCFGLVTSINGHVKAYFYKEGYIRTASKEFSLAAGQLHNKFVHLVNDAIQKNCEDYGKYEQANKLSYKDFAKYLTQRYPEKSINFERDILTQVKKIVTDTVRATFHLLDSNRRMNSFELFGYDIMFNDEFKPYLIEVNSNPSLECSSNLLSKFFAEMIDGTLRLAVDPLLPPADGFSQKKGALGIELCPQTKFELVFDESVDGEFLRRMQSNINPNDLKEIQEIVESHEENDEQDLEQENDAEFLEEQENKLEFVLAQEVSPKADTTKFVSFE